MSDCRTWYHVSQTALAQRLDISQSRISAKELEPDSNRVERLLTILAALHHEVLVQPKQGLGGDTPAIPDW